MNDDHERDHRRDRDLPETDPERRSPWRLAPRHGWTSARLAAWVEGRLHAVHDGGSGENSLVVPGGGALYGVTVVEPDRLDDPGSPAARMSFLGDTLDLDLDRVRSELGGFDAVAMTAARWVGVARSPLRPGSFAVRHRVRVVMVAGDDGSAQVMRRSDPGCPAQLTIGCPGELDLLALTALWRTSR